MSDEHRDRSEDPVRQVAEHLQAAALEVIGAMRALLDVAEEVVRDPAHAAAMVSSLAESGRRSVAPAPQDSTAASRNGDSPVGAPRVTRIRVS